MSKQTEPMEDQAKAAPISTHSLSWIAMVSMAVMCLGALIYAASINLD